MNTKIELEYDGKSYTLEYDRMGVKMLENNNFNMDEFMSKPITNIDLAFQGAFLKNHAKEKLSVINDIYDSCPNKTELIASLQQMITETYDSLLSDPEDNTSKKATWKTVSLAPMKDTKAAE